MYKALLTEISSISGTHKKMIVDIYKKMSEGINSPSVEYMPLIQSFDYIHLDNEEIVACFGCDKRPTPHLMGWEGVNAYGWCIWDAFFICSVLKKQSVIESTDPISGQSFKIIFDGEEFNQKDLFFSFPIEQNDATLDLRSCFCQRVHGFVNEKNAQDYAQQYGCEVVSSDVMLDRANAMVNALTQ